MQESDKVDLIRPQITLPPGYDHPHGLTNPGYGAQHLNGQANLPGAYPGGPGIYPLTSPPGYDQPQGLNYPGYGDQCPQGQTPSPGAYPGGPGIYPLTSPPGYDQPHGLNHPGYGDQYPLGQAPVQCAFQGGQLGYPQATGYGDSSAVVVSRNTTNPGTPSSSYMGFAIFACLCCWPIGFVAMIFAVKVNDENTRGNWEEAKSASKTALWCSVAALVCGSMCVIMVVIIYVTVYIDY